MFWVGVVYCLAAFLRATSGENYTDNESVKLFQEYVSINTTTNNNLTEAVNFWKTLAASEGLDISVIEFTAGYPLLVIKWPGCNSSLSSVMLNSHMDVVPAAESDGWTHPPFSGYLDGDGVIWGRGTQDMKSVAIQYFEALRRIKAKNVTLLRDVYMTLMPDEEVGGVNGMIPFVASDVFKAMNVGVELDEGASYDQPFSPVFYQDKVPWQIQVDCYGESGHSSTFPAANQTAAGRCVNVINRMYQFRDEEYAKYISNNGTFNAGVYTAVNMNKLSGGTANNVIASHVSLVFDLRLNVTLNATAFDAQLRQWIESPYVNMTYLVTGPQSPATIISNNNPYWTTFKNATSSLNLQIVPLVSPGATDGRHVRDAGIPSFSFSPMPNTPTLLHSVNERLAASVFLRGIDIYEALITGMANIAGDRTSTDPSVYLVATTKA